MIELRDSVLLWQVFHPSESRLFEESLWLRLRVRVRIPTTLDAISASSYVNTAARDSRPLADIIAAIVLIELRL
jgi:hypothetical protein